MKGMMPEEARIEDLWILFRQILPKNSFNSCMKSLCTYLSKIKASPIILKPPPKPTATQQSPRGPILRQTYQNFPVTVKRPAIPVVFQYANRLEFQRRVDLHLTGRNLCETLPYMPKSSTRNAA